MSESGVQEDACEETENAKRSSLYVFPNLITMNQTTTQMQRMLNSGAQPQQQQLEQQQQEEKQKRLVSDTDYHPSEQGIKLKINKFDKKFKNY